MLSTKDLLRAPSNFTICILNGQQSQPTKMDPSTSSPSRILRIPTTSAATRLQPRQLEMAILVDASRRLSSTLSSSERSPISWATVNMRVVVVGGGLGGLSAAVAIARQSGVRGVSVLEARETVGGRMRTRYGADARPLYEEGAWRISGDHRRMTSICSEYRLDLMQVTSEGSEASRAWLDPDACDPAPKEVSGDSCPRGTLSSWDVTAGSQGVRGADLKAARSGYAGMGVMAAGSNSYGAETAEKATRFSETYYVPTRGMSSICTQLREELELRPHCRVHLKTRVTDVQPSKDGYRVLCEERVGGNAFSGKSFWADVVVLAVPPSHVAKWLGVARQLAPVLAALSPVPLLKVFSEAGPEFREAMGLGQKSFHIKSNTLGQQIISNTYPGTDFVQLAYCAGQRAESLEHFRLCGDVMGPLSREILRSIDIDADRKRRLRQALLSKKHAVHFWSEAVHVWNPSYGLDVALKSAQACLMPHACLPRLFLCGEAFSTKQGWGEGALQTSELVAFEVARIAEFVAREGVFPPQRVPRGLYPSLRDSEALMTYDGRILDVGEWAKAHPGSEAAVRAHLGEDVTELWESVMHPRYALGIIFALQVGWTGYGCYGAES